MQFNLGIIARGPLFSPKRGEECEIVNDSFEYIFKF